ncbi:MAG: hypothetical protein Q9165_004093 [Trypethelium subeluteriae]
MDTADSFKITFFGRGSHASVPQKAVDPIVMGASAVIRLQTIISREISPSEEIAVATIGAFHAGESENKIQDKAEMRVNIRTFDSDTRNRAIEGVRRIIKAESQANGSSQEPLIKETSSFPLTSNDPALAEKLSTSFAETFGEEFNPDIARNNASEDFSILAASIGKPYAYLDLWRNGHRPVRRC